MTSSTLQGVLEWDTVATPFVLEWRTLSAGMDVFERWYRSRYGPTGRA